MSIYEGVFFILTFFLLTAFALGPHPPGWIERGGQCPATKGILSLLAGFLDDLFLVRKLFTFIGSRCLAIFLLLKKHCKYRCEYFSEAAMSC
jgi:hypothetical protein